jgi:lipopolysaccharide biosynthesis protein
MQNVAKNILMVYGENSMTSTGPKIIAFYLPQFHCIKENDEWWGDGFTDWINVKKAIPLYKNHRQPKIPQNNNYYDLLDENIFPWQIELAKTNGIDGFCFYHYWFDGKMLLEKPAENFLSKKNLDFSFCFSWANEPWTRSWDGKEKEILIPQKYTGIKDIVSHIEYLFPFFKDKRYIKIDNKPVFLIYRANSIIYINQMIDVWNTLAQGEGFDGIHFCETLTGFQKQKCLEKTDSMVYMEPMWIIGKKSKIAKLWTARYNPVKLNRIENYNHIWEKIIKDEIVNERSFGGAFVDWDNSPRKNKNNLVLRGSSPEKFEYYMRLQYEKSRTAGSPFVFINAWNEWAEGTYLEPDTYYGEKYLEAVKRIKCQ